MIPALPAGHSTVRQELAWAGERLLAAAVGDPRREAQVLLAHVLGANRAFVLAHGEEPLPRTAATLFRALVARRARREPYAYLCGERDWLDVSLAVDRNVLIPRPETELLAHAAIQEARQIASGGVAPVVVDVGTGSGAIALAVARGCPEARVYATDASAGALRVAARNIARWAPGRVRLRACDLLSGVEGPATIIVANLPYIPTRDLAGLEPELAFEPRLALDGGPDGLDPIRAVLAQAPGHLAPPGALLLECGHDQAGRIAALATAHWPAARVEVHTDLAGAARFVHIYLPDGYA